MLALLPCASAIAQPTDDIVIVGTRTREALRDFVGAVAMTPPSENQLARWDNRICPLVTGLSERQAQRVADRIAQRAAGIGLQPGRAGCEGNVLVFVTADSDAFARELFADDPALFAYLSEDGITTNGRDALRDFLDTPRPVRWWHVAYRSGSDGLGLGSDTSRLMQRTGMMPPGAYGGYTSYRSEGTRLRSDTRQDLHRAVVIVDARRVEGVSIEVWSDYVAMVALAQIDPYANTEGFPTVLNLFSARTDQAQARRGLTDWDTDYLTGLYQASRDAVNSQQQRHQIVERMATPVR